MVPQAYSRILGTTPTNPVQIEQGLIAGIYNEDRSVRLFAGVPYAAPPTGPLRWSKPQPPEAWPDVRQADNFSAIAMQLRAPEFFWRLVKSPFTAEYTVGIQEPMSEDCLYLNIWTAATSAQEKRPVIVYIHGGGFLTGSGSVPIYDGEETARKGAVMVTINYRLGVFGFLAHPELSAESESGTSGNYGLMDQIAALAWVRRNIAAFGGDPSNITVAGQSAGAMSVNALLVSPLAEGLFQQAIAESGGLFSDLSFPPILTLADAEQQGLEFAQALKAESLDELRKLSPLRLTLPFGVKPVVFAPIIDGYLLPEPILERFKAGKQHPVPVLIGSNQEEGEAILFGSEKVAKFAGKIMSKFIEKEDDKKDGFEKDDIVEDDVEKEVGKKEAGKKDGSKKDDWFLSVIPVENEQIAKRSERSIVRDQQFGWNMNRWASLAAKTGHSDVYYYFFDRVPPNSSFGAFHTAEVEYAYSNLKFSTIEWEPADYELSETMADYWLNFARTGDPNGPGLPHWQTYQTSIDQVMELGDHVGMISVPHLEDYRYFDSLDPADERPADDHPVDERPVD